MFYDLENFIYSIINWFVWFYNSPYMIVVKIFVGIYLAVLLINIIFLLVLRDIPQHLRIGIRGMDIPAATKSKMRKRWEKVKSLLESNNASQYKLAIIEADSIADEILSGIGYTGANMGEKLDKINKKDLDDNLESLRGAHQIRNRIVHEADFEVDYRMARTVIGVYENFLRYLEFLD
ncbi:MAG: hypothetical protein ACOYB5_01995 [Patescibacteria group bacterium]|jgi:uncharacterized protein YutE (UPF0331/DUF86 family)